MARLDAVVAAAAARAVDRAGALRRLARGIHGDHPAAHAAVARDPRRCSRQYAVRALATTPLPAGIEIRTAPTVLEPGVVGLRRPVILLPEGIDSYLTAEAVRRGSRTRGLPRAARDNLTAAIHMVVEAVFWFHPMVWWIGARLVATREQACDEHVVAETAEPIAYAEGIASVCRRYVETPHMAVAGVGGADVKARIDANLANRIGLRLTLPKRLVLAAVAVLSLTVPIVTGAIERRRSLPAISKRRRRWPSDRSAASVRGGVGQTCRRYQRPIRQVPADASAIRQ